MTGRGARARARAAELEELDASMLSRETKEREESTRNIVQPCKFYGEPGDDVEKWLKSFDRISKANNWSGRRQREILPAFLRERAAEFYDELPSDLTMEELRNALMQQFMPKEARRFYYADLYGKRQGEEESAGDFGRTIQQLVRRAHADMPGEYQDTLMREHFINGLRPGLKRMVLLADPTTFLKAMEVARREEINEQITNNSMPWARMTEARHGYQGKPTEAPVAAIYGEKQKEENRMDRLEAAIEKLAVTVNNMQAPRQERRPWRNSNNNSNESRNLRCTDGRPICNFCKRVGHVEVRCHEKKSSQSQTAVDSQESKN